MKKELSYLQPIESIQVNGKISYKEELRAWGLIQLRKEILGVFPQLKERRGNFGYTMFYNRSPKEMKKTLDELDKKGLVPILLLLGKVKDN